MKKLLFFLALLSALALNATDFSELSTEELVALIGYVEASEQKAFYEELERRIPFMSEEQKLLYDDDHIRRVHEQN